MYIRKATEADIPGIINITHLAFKIYRDETHTDVKLSALTEGEEVVKRDIQNDEVFVAIQNRRIYGCIRVHRLSPDLAYIYRFAVDPDEHNAGVGTKLIEHAIEYCTEAGFAAIALHTNAKYFKLARYYYGRQFYVHSTRDDRGYIRALFVKELSDKKFDLSPAFEK